MKLVLIVLSLVVLVTSQAKRIPKPPAECAFCSIGVDTNLSCICSSSTRVARKYACGPACTALGYCCESVQCPTCGSGVNPINDSSCTCADLSTPLRVKYACGPACDALGYCCAP